MQVDQRCRPDSAPCRTATTRSAPLPRWRWLACPIEAFHCQRGWMPSSSARLCGGRARLKPRRSSRARIRRVTMVLKTRILRCSAQRRRSGTHCQTPGKARALRASSNATTIRKARARLRETGSLRAPVARAPKSALPARTEAIDQRASVVLRARRWSSQARPETAESVRRVDLERYTNEAREARAAILVVRGRAGSQSPPYVSADTATRSRRAGRSTASTAAGRARLDARPDGDGCVRA